MLRPLTVSLVLALAAPLAAMEFFPPAPDSRTVVQLLTQTPFCQIERTDVALQGYTITVTPVSAGGNCIGPSFPLRIDLGLVPPGIYTVVTPFEQGRLLVREGDPKLLVSPVGGPNDGKRTAQIFGAKPGDVVLFDGIPAPAAAQQLSNDSLVVTPRRMRRERSTSPSARASSSLPTPSSSAARSPIRSSSSRCSSRWRTTEWESSSRSGGRTTGWAPG